jgi:hypothetical protein
MTPGVTISRSILSSTHGCGGPLNLKKENNWFPKGIGVSQQSLTNSTQRLIGNMPIEAFVGCHYPASILSRDVLTFLSYGALPRLTSRNGKNRTLRPSKDYWGHSPIRAIVYAKDPDFLNKDCQVKSTDTGFRRCLLSRQGIGTNRLFAYSMKRIFLFPVCRSWERPVDGSSDKPGGWSIRLPPRRLTS